MADNEGMAGPSGPNLRSRQASVIHNPLGPTIEHSDEEEDYEDTRSQTMSVPPKKPSKFGGNRETAIWLEHKIDSGIQSLRESHQDMQRDLSAFLEFHRIERGIPKGSDLSTPSQWRALQGTGSGGPSGNPTNPAPTRTNPAPRTGGGGGDDPDNSDSSDDSGEGNRRQPRNGNSDAGNIPGPDGRGETPQSSFTVGGTHKLKREDIGSFDPEYDDPNDVGVVTEGRNLIFTDVYSFSDRINSLLEDDATRSSNESQIMALLPTLLTGSAVLWWNNELTATGRKTHRQGGIKKVIEALQERFGLDAGVATQRFDQTTLTLRDIQRNKHELPQFIQRKLRYARAMGILTADNVNWKGVMTQIRNSMSLEVKQFIRPPRKSQTLEEYMALVEEARGDLDDMAREVGGERNPTYHATHGRPSRTRTTAQKGYYTSQDDVDRVHFASSPRYAPRNNRRYWSNDRGPRDGYNPQDDYAPRDNRGFRGSSEFRGGRYPRSGQDGYRGGGWTRSQPRDRSGERFPPRQRNDDKDKDKDRRDYDRKREDANRVHFAEQTDGSDGDGDYSDGARSYDNDHDEVVYSHCVVDAGMTCPRCHEHFHTVTEKLKHHRACKKDLALETLSSPSPVDPVRRTCGYCDTLFPSRNRLFKHLRKCPMSAAGTVRNPKAVLSRKVAPEGEVKKKTVRDEQMEEIRLAAIADEDVPVEDATDVCDTQTDLYASSFSYLKFKVRSSPTAEDVEICGDPGTGRTIIGRKFLQQFNHVIVPRRATLKGIGKGSVKATEWAEFVFYCRGVNKNGDPKTLIFQKGGWIVDDELEPGCLIGNDFWVPHAANIDFLDSKITFTQRDGFNINFSAVNRGYTLNRKVTSKRAVKLRRGESAYIAVEYKPLPTDRNFCFFSSHQSAMHTVLDARTPRVVPVTNATDKILHIDKGAKLGHITENQSSGCYKVSWKGAMKVLSFAIATAGAMCGVMNQGGSIDATSDVAVNAEFNLDPIAHAVATDTVPARDSFTLDEMAKVAENCPGHFDSVTPVSDAVFSIVQSSPEVPPPVSDGTFLPAQGASHVPPPASMDDAPTPNMPATLKVALPKVTAVDEVPTVSVGATDPEIAAPLEPPKPKLSEIYTTLGIKKPEDLPERVTKDGIHIYAEQASIADQFAEVIEAWDIWTDKGTVDIPLDQQMKIPLVEGWQNHKLSSRPYPLSRKDMVVLNKIHDGLHEKGRMDFVDEPCPFAHPLFVVWRTVHGEDKGRVVNDLRNLNKVAVPDNYPLPLQANVINALKGKRFITVVDATGFFHQFSVHPDYRDRFTIISPRGIERSKVALMGFRNTPAYVQRYMDRLLYDHSHYCQAFIDDICIFSETAEDHKAHLEKIFSIFKAKNIAINPKKSFIGYPSVELLGFRVDAFGMATSKDKLEAFRKLDFPGQLKALEQYIGASGFLRKMIPYYAQLIGPLQDRKTSLLAAGRKEGRVANANKRKFYCQSTYYQPTPAEIASFKAMQDAICKETNIYHHDPDRRLFIQLDGSKERGFGVMLFHLQPGTEWKPGDVIPSTAVQPVMFLSKCISKAEIGYGPSELEVACLVWAAKKLRTVIGSSKDPVIVLTDHSATKGIVDQTNLNTSATDRANIRLVNSSVYLSQYGLQVYHLPGRLNLVPDALSRLKTVTDAIDETTGKLVRDDEPATLDTIWYASTTEVVMDDTLLEKFKKAYESDPKFAAILQELHTNEDVDIFSKPGYPFEVRNGLVYNTYDGVKRLCVPHGMIKDVLAIAHDDKHHFGTQRMLQDLEPYQIYRKTYLVKKYIKHCHTCEVNRTDRQLPVGSLHPIRPKDPLPMRTIAMDFILALPTVKSSGTPWQLSGSKAYYSEFNQLLTVSCPTSKRTLLIPGHEKYTAEEWGTALTKQLLLSDWGIPKAIISDRDRKFTSEVWQGIWKALGTRLLMTTAYHPQADGLSERKNQTVEIAIRYHNFTNPEACWLDVIPSLQWNLNAAYSEAIQSTPHEQLFGFKLPGALETLTLTEADTERFTDVRFFREHLRRDAHLAMDFAAVRAKKYYDGKHRALEFQEGDQVYLKLHSGYHLPGNPSRKYSQQLSGPWTVKRRVGSLAYELDFPENYRIHPVISVTHLRPASGEDPFERDVPPPGPVEADQDPEGEGDSYEVELVLNHRKGRKAGTTDYLIKWKGWGHQYNQWMTEANMSHSKELIEDYWERHGGRENQQAKRGRGRPRKG